MEIKNHKILLTVIDRGRLGAPVSNVSSKELRSKVICSPFEDHILDRKGVPTGKYNTPKGHFKAPNNFIERSELPCTLKSTLSEDVVNYFVSNKSCPHFINSKKWEKMTELEKLEIHLGLTSEGKKFTYEII